MLLTKRKTKQEECARMSIQVCLIYFGDGSLSQSVKMDVMCDNFTSPACEALIGSLTTMGSYFPHLILKGFSSVCEQNCLIY